MPHKGESASFFSLHFLLQCSGRYPPSSPFLPPLSPVPSPIASPGESGRRSFHAGAQTLYFQRNPAAGDQERRPAPGGQPACPRRQRGLSSQEEPGLREQQKPRLPAPASPGAPGRRERRKRLRGARGPGTAAGTSSGRPLCPAAGPASAPGAGAPRERLGGRLAARRPARPPARPPPLCRARAGHRSPPALERRGAARPPSAGAESIGKASARCRGRGRACERESGRKPPGQSGRTSAPRELRVGPRIVSFHQALRLLPPAGAQSSERANSSPQASLTFAPAV